MCSRRGTRAGRGATKPAREGGYSLYARRGAGRQEATIEPEKKTGVWVHAGGRKALTVKKKPSSRSPLQGKTRMFHMFP